MNHFVEIKPLIQKDIQPLTAAFLTIGWDKPVSLFERYLKEQTQGQRVVWVGVLNNEPAGYVTLKWESAYIPFRERSIPEIKDLNVLPNVRKQGVGSQLLQKAEKESAQKSNLVGIGVGLTTDYGAAQRLYVERGYVPDGRGITYNYQPIKYGTSVALDDDLVLWLVKNVI